MGTVGKQWRTTPPDGIVYGNNGQLQHFGPILCGMGANQWRLVGSAGLVGLAHVERGPEHRRSKLTGIARQLERISRPQEFFEPLTLGPLPQWGEG